MISRTKPTLSRFWPPLLLVVGLGVSIFLCSLCPCWGPVYSLYKTSQNYTPGAMYQYSENLVKPTNEINFQELWSLEVGYQQEFQIPSGGIAHRSLLAADTDKNGRDEIFVEKYEANQILVIEDGQARDELTLQVPGRTFLGLSEVVKGTSLAKIVSSGMHVSLVDLTTGEVVQPLGYAKGNIAFGDRLLAADLTGDGQNELIVQKRPEGSQNRHIMVYEAQGHELWDIEVEREAKGRTPINLMCLGDAEGNGCQDILLASWGWWLLIEPAGTGIRGIGSEDQQGAGFYAGDIDNNGEVELVAGLGNPPSTLGVYDLEGRMKWGHRLGETEHGVVGDVDGDGDLEIAVFDRRPHWTGGSSRNVGGADYWIFLFDAQGNLLWNYMVNATELYPGGFADVNGDGKDELIFFEYQYGKPRILHAYGTVP